MNRASVFTSFVFLVCCVIASNTGCSSFGTLKSSQLPVNQAAQSSAGTYTVEMHSTFGKPQMITGQIDDRTSVQSVLESSGAIKKYRTMEINVVRRVAENGRILKMPVSYDTRAKTVKVGMDYAVHPGDRIVISPESSGPLEKMVNSVTGSL